MKKNELIADAMQILIDTHIANGKNVEKAYNGAIASFGASLTQSGLLPTLAIYKHDSGEASRPKIMEALYQMLKSYHPGLPAPTHTDLFEYALALFRTGNNAQTALLEQYIARYAVALKLALRTFNLI